MRARAAVGLVLAFVTMFAATAQAHTGGIGHVGATLEHQAGTLAVSSNPAAPAQASAITRAGAAVVRVDHKLAAAASTPSGSTCQTLTVVNQANVRPLALASVEFAVELQAEQLRAACGTPCVQYGPGGWPVYLQVQVEHWPDGSETLPIGGEHYGSAVPGPLWHGMPYAVVDTGAATYEQWSYTFSHEIPEMLVDPSDDLYRVWPTGARQLLEVCDPVENVTYAIDGVSVDDFTPPAAWSGGVGPYDEAGRLTAPLAPGYTLGLESP